MALGGFRGGLFGFRDRIQSCRRSFNSAFRFCSALASDYSGADRADSGAIERALWFRENGDLESVTSNLSPVAIERSLLVADRGNRLAKSPPAQLSLSSDYRRRRHFR